MSLFSRNVPATSVIAILVCLSAIGCDNDGRMEIQGTATWNGEPIKDGYVELRPTDGQGQVVGADIRDGAFTIRTVAGEKSVSVTAREIVGETPPSERIPHPEPIYSQILPRRFNDESEMRVTIVADEPTLRLALEGEAARPDPRGATAAR